MHQLESLVQLLLFSCFLILHAIKRRTDIDRFQTFLAETKFADFVAMYYKDIGRSEKQFILQIIFSNIK